MQEQNKSVNVIQTLNDFTNDFLLSSWVVFFHNFLPGLLSPRDKYNSACAIIPDPPGLCSLDFPSWLTQHIAGSLRPGNICPLRSRSAICRGYTRGGGEDRCDLPTGGPPGYGESRKLPGVTRGRTSGGESLHGLKLNIQILLNLLEKVKIMYGLSKKKKSSNTQNIFLWIIYIPPVESPYFKE